MEIDSARKDAMRRLLALAGMKQFAVAHYMGVSPSVVSEMLSPNKDRTLQDETWERVASGLARIVAEFKERSADDPAAGQEADRLLALATTFSVAPLTATAGLVQEPGGWIAAGARNYIQRPIDRTLDRYLAGASSPFVIISGPIQSGRSSAVRRLSTSAERAGFLSAFVDMAELVDGQATWTAEHVIRLIYQRIDIQPPRGSVGKGELASEMAAAFFRGLDARIAWVPRAFVIFDSFDTLARSVEEGREAELLTAWLTAVRGLSAKPPFDRLTVGVVTNSVEWPTIVASSAFLGLGRQITTGKFRDEDIEAMMDALAIDDGREAAAEAAREHFGGHPFLTHLFLSELAAGATPDDVKESANALEGDFGRYWRRIEQAVIRHFREHKEKEKRAAALLAATLDRVEGRSAFVDSDDLRFLRGVGLVDGPPDQPDLCGFYRTAIRQSTVR